MTAQQIQQRLDELVSLWHKAGRKERYLLLLEQLNLEVLLRERKQLDREA